MNDQIEQAIVSKGLTAPRITKEHIENAIVAETYHRFPGTTLTVCVLTLYNGFNVTGESACASPENFDEAIGRMAALEAAKQKIWWLEGYLLKFALHAVSQHENMARVAHEVNRAYCQALGDNSQPAWEAAPAWQRESALNGVLFHINNPDAAPEATHEAWRAEKIASGWTYGEVKDAEKKEHPCMRPFDELPRHQQAKDHIFRAVVRSMAFPFESA